MPADGRVTIKVGRSHHFAFKYAPEVPAGQTKYSKNFYTTDNRYTGRLVIRRKLNDEYMSGDIIDTLVTTTTVGQQNSQGRIRFPNIGATSNESNIDLYFSGAETSLWANEHITVAGDLQITDTDVAATECIHSWRIEFKTEPEIV